MDKYWQSPIASNLPSNISSRWHWRRRKISNPLIFGFAKQSHYLCLIFHRSPPSSSLSSWSSSSSSLSSSPSSSPPPLVLGLSVVFSVRQQPRQPILAKLQADNRHCFYQIISVFRFLWIFRKYAFFNWPFFLNFFKDLFFVFVTQIFCKEETSEK